LQNDLQIIDRRLLRLGWNKKRVPILCMGTRPVGIFDHLFCCLLLTLRFLFTHDGNYRNNNSRCYQHS